MDKKYADIPLSFATDKRIMGNTVLMLLKLIHHYGERGQFTESFSSLGDIILVHRNTCAKHVLRLVNAGAITMTPTQETLKSPCLGIYTFKIDVTGVHNVNNQS